MCKTHWKVFFGEFFVHVIHLTIQFIQKLFCIDTMAAIESIIVQQTDICNDPF